jgi:hypothetical protein
MSRRNPKITIAGPVSITDATMGFDGEHFYVEINGAVIAKRGLGEFEEGDESEETYDRLRRWSCIEPGWSVIETGRPKRSGTGDLHFRYDPAGAQQ